MSEGRGAGPAGRGGPDGRKYQLYAMVTLWLLQPSCDDAEFAKCRTGWYVALLPAVSVWLDGRVSMLKSDALQPVGLVVASYGLLTVRRAETVPKCSSVVVLVLLATRSRVLEPPGTRPVTFAEDMVMSLVPAPVSAEPAPVPVLLQ